MQLKKTPFYNKHLQNNARMIDYNGWVLPLEYKSVLQEAKHVRSQCGLFDVSHMGEISVRGKDAFSFLQYLVSNDIYSLIQGRIQYNLFLNNQGGIIEDFMLYHLGDSLLCVVNACNKDKVLNWLNQNIKGDVCIEDRSDETALISIQGPNSMEVMKAVFGPGIDNIGRMNFVQQQLGGIDVIISRSGYTGEDGFEIYFPWNESVYLWDRIVDAGSRSELLLCGLGSRDILRIEAGYPLYGQEIDEHINPYEASLAWVVKNKRDYIAKENMVLYRSESLMRKRVGFFMKDRSFPRKGCLVYAEERIVGVVTSGVYSPNAGKFIGMAFLEYNCAAVSLEINIEVRGKLYKAEIAKFPLANSKQKVVK